MDAKDITDVEGLERWLEGRSQGDAVCIAQRAASRAFPLWAVEMDSDWARETNLSALPVLRALLTAGVARGHLIPEIRSAAAAAFVPAYSAAGDAAIGSAENASNAAFIAAFAADCAVDPSAASSTLGHAVRTAGSSAWSTIYFDVLVLSAGGDPTSTPLWPVSSSDLFNEIDTRARAIWSREPETWDFWLRWWDGMLAGKPLDWELQRDVALIPDEDWQKGPSHIAGLIRGIEDRHRAAKVSDARKEADTLPKASAETIEHTRVAMERNRASLPPTLDAIEGLILLEIERLQGRNYIDDFDRQECHRQIGVFLALHEAITTLRAQLPATGPVLASQAEESERWHRVYVRKFKESVPKNADAVVDGVWVAGKGIVQVGLIGLSTALAVAYGLPATAAATVGAIVFAPKNSAEIIKAAREALSKGP